MALVDLSVTIGPETLSPPSMDARLALKTFHRSPGYWQSTLIEMSLHTGSHVDFARHVVEDGETAADASLDQLCGSARILNLCDAGADGAITLDAVRKRGQLVKPGEIAIIRTDWAETMWGTFPDYYLHSPLSLIHI